MLDLSREMALRISLVRAAADEVEAIVTDCAGCSALATEYAEWRRTMTRPGGNALHRFSAKVRDVPRARRQLAGRLPLAHRPASAIYHDPVSPGEPGRTCAASRDASLGQ